MHNLKIKYLFILGTTAVLSTIIIFTNILYSKLSDKRVSFETIINQEQELINNRNYVVTALYAIEGILDSTISNELIKINKQLPSILANDDFQIPTELLWRYQQLQKLLTEYVSKDDYYNYQHKLELKQQILLEITALKTELEAIINQNESIRDEVTEKYNQVRLELEQLFIIVVILFSLIIFSLYYFLRHIKADNKFKLLDLAKESVQSVAPVYKDAIIAIEHSCQRINYNNTIVIKQLHQQKELIATIQSDYYKLKEIVDKLDIINKNKGASVNSRASFRLYANIVDINKAIEKNFNTLIQENGSFSIQLYKNIKTINNIFKYSQKLSDATSLDAQEVIHVEATSTKFFT